MSLFAIVTGVLLLASLVIAGGWWCLATLLRRRPSRYWRRVLLVHVVLLPLYLFGAAPAVLGWAASRIAVRTRGDESAWQGPRLAADGSLVEQSRASLREHAAPPGEPVPAVWLRSADGVDLRGFYLAPRAGPPRCAVLLVHGLFRGGLELEPVAAMWRDLGAAVLLLEMRNHGASGRAPATYGRDEANDVAAAYDWLAARPELIAVPRVVFGVSLGGAAVALAAPQLVGLRALVLDAPMDELEATAHRMLGEPHPRRPVVPQPFRWLTLWWLQRWSGFSFAEVRPIDALRALDPGVAVLMIGAGDDRRMPPAVARAVFDAVPAERKELWVCPGADHGRVWEHDPAGYRERLGALIDRL